MANSTKKLTPRQRRFVAEYLVDLNATQAAVRAGYSAKAAHSTGPRMMANAGVQAAIQAANKRREERTEITADRVLLELGRIALADVGQAFDENGAVLPLSEMPEDIRRALGGVEHNEFGVKLKFLDKTKALELLGKHHRLFTEVIEAKIDVDGITDDERTARIAALLERARARRA